ncbi:uncharacterized protein LOC141905396 [Tubulanus polymorphus]|uniref:uncharacterized protein LOC141905396 n=1 Tax=Tubulanus polymorphus TaxID=672921 RepID=UPI003DA4E519
MLSYSITEISKLICIITFALIALLCKGNPQAHTLSPEYYCYEGVCVDVVKKCPPLESVKCPGLCLKYYFKLNASDAYVKKCANNEGVDSCPAQQTDYAATSEDIQSISTSIGSERVRCSFCCYIGDISLNAARRHLDPAAAPAANTRIFENPTCCRRVVKRFLQDALFDVKCDARAMESFATSWSFYEWSPVI